MIKVPKDLESVKQRPGMYTRTDNLLYIVRKVINNSADEALGGYDKLIVVTLHRDGSASVEDDVRGVPVGIYPKEDTPMVEIVYTCLHADGKFDKGRGGAYAFLDGLHGMGVSVANALSMRLEVTVWRDGNVSILVFSGGDVIEPLTTRKAKHGEKKSGTRVRAWPDAKYSGSENIPFAELQCLLRSRAVLLPGVKVTLTLEKTDETLEWQYDQGLRGYLVESPAQGSDAEPVIPLLEDEHFADPDKPGEGGFALGESASWVVTWTGEGPPVCGLYVNLIPAPAGGTREPGLYEGLFQAVKSLVEIHALLPRDVKLMFEDVFARASLVLSAKILGPQFQGQIEERLNSRDAVWLVSTFSHPALELWLNQHVDHGKKLAELAIKQAQACIRTAQKVEKKKGSDVIVLPGKLTNCESDNVARNELLLMEGDSAGGSAKMGRGKESQTTLPLRGKVLNTWETGRNRLFANSEIHDVAVAVGVDLYGPNDTVDLPGLRYSKICILSDVNVDGAHIQALLLTPFFKHFPRLIDRGHVCVARPPLYRVDVSVRGKKSVQKFYALGDGELETIEDKLRKGGVKDGAWQVSRSKGLGGMSAGQLWGITTNPDIRRLLPVALGELGQDQTINMINMLMGKGEAGAHRTWLEAYGNEVKVDI